MSDPLFSVRNNYYIGAFQKAVSEASQLTGLSEQQKIERDVFVYRSYIEMGSYEVGGRSCSSTHTQRASPARCRWAAPHCHLPALLRPCLQPLPACLPVRSWCWRRSAAALPWRCKP